MKTVLVVDDEADIARTLQVFIELHGYRTLVAFDGVEALHTAFEKQLDLVVTDITMPRMDGLELVEQLHASPACRQLPIILISAHNLKGHDDIPFLRKPFDPNALIAEIRRLLGD